MNRFVIEFLPRPPAKYEVIPLNLEQAKAWLEGSVAASLILTRELITAVELGMGVTLTPADGPLSLRPGDEALLINLSFGVLLAWVEGKIAPLAEDWRCSLLTVDSPRALVPAPVLEAAVAEDLLAGPAPE
jgi:hypothetical protein